MNQNRREAFSRGEARDQRVRIIGSKGTTRRRGNDQGRHHFLTRVDHIEFAGSKMSIPKWPDDPIAGPLR